MLKVGDAIGWLPTLAIVIFTAFLGTAMLRQQGMATLNTARQRLDAGEMPAQQMLEGMLLLVGGVLLLTPGFVTDAFGFACLVPATRHWIVQRIASRSVVSVGGVVGSAEEGVAHRALARSREGLRSGPGLPRERAKATHTPRIQRLLEGVHNHHLPNRHRPVTSSTQSSSALTNRTIMHNSAVCHALSVSRVVNMDVTGK